MIDVWESREAFEQHARERITPAMQQLGAADVPMEPKEFEVHNVVTS